MPRSGQKIIQLLATVCATGLISNGALAQEEATTGIEDIVVTAQKREESLQQVPIAVTALTAAALESQGVRDITGLAASIPNVTVSNGPQGSSDANFFVRGVGQFDFIITNDPGVGVYLDGVYLGRTVGALLDASDIARIEVLRGPQGTLFGRNTLGGAVSVISKAPDPNALSGSARATFGSRERIDVDGSINAPLSETAAVRLHAFTRNQDGQARSAQTGDTYADTNKWGARGSVLIEVNEAFKITLSGDFLKDRGSPNPIVNVGLAPAPFIPADAINDRSDDFYTTFQSNEARSDIDIYGFSANAELTLDALTIRSITAYRNLEAFSTSDSDGTGYTLYDQTSDLEQDQFSQEFQFLGSALDDRLQWLAGLYYFKETGRQVQELCFAPLLLPPPGSGLPPALPPGYARGAPCPFWFQDNDQTTKSYAAFGQVSFTLVDALKLTLGGRYTRDEKSIVTTQALRIPGGITVVPIVNNLQDDANFDKFTPKVGIDYTLSDGTLLFASYSKGFRSGGFNGRLIVPNTRVPAFSPDTNDAFEAGFKTDLADNRLRVNGTVFYSKYKGIQQTITDPAVQFRVANAGDAEFYGFELEVTAQPVPALLMNLSLGYTHSELTSTDPASGIAEGNKLPYSPDWTVGASVQYDFDFGDLGIITPRADLRYQSSVVFSPFNLPLERQDGYALLNLRLGWTSQDDRFSAAIFGQNITGKTYYIFGQDAVANQGVAYAHLGRPFEWGVTLGAKF